MAFKPVNIIPGIGELELIASSSTAVLVGQLVYRDSEASTYSVLRPVTQGVASTTSILNIFGIATKAETTGSGTVEIKVIPINSGLYVEADCVSNTGDGQLMKCHALASGTCVTNTLTHIKGNLGVFLALKVIGASTDKKLFGRFIQIDQTVNATT